MQKPTRLKRILGHHQLLSTERPHWHKETFRVGCCWEAKTICPEFTACNLISSSCPCLCGRERGRSQTHGSQPGCLKSHPTRDSRRARRVQLWEAYGEVQAFGEGLRVYGAAGWGLFAGCESLRQCLNPKHQGEEEDDEL